MSLPHHQKWVCLTISRERKFCIEHEIALLNKPGGLRKAEIYVIVRRRSHCIPEEARALAWQLSSGGS
jgi:hypothetical protein